MKKQLNLLAILLLLVTLPMYSTDAADSNNTIDRSTGIASIITQSSGVVNVGNSCFGRPAGTFEATVNDENGTPAIGASILIVGTTKGAYVKRNGVGLVPNLYEDTYNVKISYAGYRSILDSVHIKHGDTLRKSYKFELYEEDVISCYFYCERIVDAYEIGSVTTFSSSELQGRGWGSNPSQSRRKKSTKPKSESQPIIINSTSFATNSISFNIRDVRGNKTVVLIDGLDVSNSTSKIANKVENNSFDGSDLLDNVKVFPNPTDGPFTIVLEEECDNLQILNMNGNIILSLVPKVGVNQFDLSDFANGIYFINLSYKGVWSGAQIQLRR